MVLQRLRPDLILAHATLACLALGGSASSAEPGAPQESEASVHPTAAALDELAATEFEATLAPYLERHCALCHSGPEPRSDLDLTRFAQPSELAADEGLALRLLERVQRQEMPPIGPIPPTAAEDAEFIKALERLLEQSWSPKLPLLLPHATLRRLDRFELQRVLLDLLGVEVEESRLPTDGLARGWTHAGDGQWLTAVDVERWILLLEELALRAVPVLDGQSLTFAAGDLKGGDGRGDWRSLSSSGSVSANLADLRPGRYRVLVIVAADQAGPDLARFGLRWNERLLETLEVTGADRELVELEVELDLLDVTPESNLEIAFLNDYYEPDAEDRSERDRNLYVSALQLEGPLGTADPSLFLKRAGRLDLLGPALAEAPTEAVLRELLEPLSRSAWRGRPAEGAEFESVLTSVLVEPDLGAALRAGIVELLASPRFLFVGLESERSAAGRARDLATRMSLFLWGRLPDDDLLEAAASGRLDSSDGLIEQTVRMLRAPDSEALVQRLVDRWLGLAAFESVAVEAHLEPALALSMRRETELLVSAVLREDWPLKTLIDAEFTHVDERLSEHYGLPLIGASAGTASGGHRRVSLAGTERRGLLGHAAILSLTSEPNRTSAVRRGKWVLETLLNTPPPPPPPDVGSLDAVAAAHDATLAERLALHRAAPACAGCHTTMDAIGLDLESFGARGRRVPGSDAAPALRLAARLAGPAARPHEPGLRRSAVEHLAELALARPLELGDRPWLGSVFEQLERGPATLRTAVLGIVLSPAFRDPGPRQP